MKALILDTQVYQIEQIDFEVAQPLYWVDCADNVTREWTYVNGVFVAPIIPPKTYTSLNPAQVRLVLHQFGLLDTVEAAIKAGDRSLQIEWDYRTEFARDNDLLVSMATTLGITDSQLDAMFEAGVLL
jgi:hypothetical protein